MFTYYLVYKRSAKMFKRKSLYFTSDQNCRYLSCSHQLSQNSVITSLYFVITCLKYRFVFLILSIKYCKYSTDAQDFFLSYTCIKIAITHLHSNTFNDYNLSVLICSLMYIKYRLISFRRILYVLIIF